jgi:phytoene dehydrogenase-like protein
MLEMPKSIIIIGAGISGLAAGCYARMNGYNTQIFEMHSSPGGLCTAWQRKDYLIDCCVHWLVGTKPNAPFYRIWQELGMIQGKTILYPDEFFSLEDQNGKIFHFYTNVDQLEKHMKELAPEDTKVIEEFSGAIRKLCGFDMPVEKPQALYSPLDYAKVMVRMGSKANEYRKWNKISINEFSSRFQNQLLRQAFQLVWPKEMAMAFFLITSAELHEKSAGYPMGGSSGLVDSLEKRYLGLGGTINYKSGVEKILAENNRAVGVSLIDGKEYKAEYIISAADVYATLFGMLDGKYLDEKTKSYYNNRPFFQPLVFIGLGINRSFEDAPKILSGTLLHLDKPIMIAGKEQNWLPVRMHNYDPSLAPRGKTLLTIAIESEFHYWESLRQDLPKYKAEKEKIAIAVVSALNKRYPGLSSQLEMWDVATPYTFYRYTGNWQGGYEGWLATPGNAELTINMKPSGLEGCYMANQWVQSSGGLPSAAMSGSHVIQLICKKDKKKFETKIP